MVLNNSKILGYVRFELTVYMDFSFSGEIDVSPSVELFSPSDFLDPDIPFICWVAHAVPSEIRVIWVVNGNEYIGLTESVWWRKNDPSTEFTQSKFWISKSDWEEGKLFSCIVEAGGKNISKSIRSKSRSMKICNAS